MSVYVDEPDKAYGRMKMCHMIADTHEQLMVMIGRIGLHHRWIQNEGTYREHFDICKSKRILAVAYGAVELSNRELYYTIRRKSESAELPGAVKPTVNGRHTTFGAGPCKRS